MADDSVSGAGKSKEEIAYMLMMDLMRRTEDGPKKPTRADYINHYAAARSAVYGSVNSAATYLK